PEDIMDYYNALIAEKENSTIKVTNTQDGRVQTTSGTGEAKVTEIALFNQKNEPIKLAKVGEPVTLKVKVKAYEDIPVLVLGYMIKDRLGTPVYGTNTWHTKQVLNDIHQDREV